MGCAEPGKRVLIYLFQGERGLSFSWERRYQECWMTKSLMDSEWSSSVWLVFGSETI